MLKSRSQTSQTSTRGAVAWHAAIGGYWITCTIVILEIDSAVVSVVSVVSVVENDQYVE